MTTFIFAGPTIAHKEAQQWLDAVYLPPVSQGDIISLLPQQPRIIGIIDGYFDRVPAVWHKEILLALAQGVHVVGAASMGALRAAELHSLGMVGVGEIFTWYRNGRIEADDEVAVQHAPAAYGYRPMNEALVNMRQSLAMACEAGLIAPETRDALIGMAQATPYWERDYGRLLTQAATSSIPSAELTPLKAFLETNAVDLKKQDAIALLQYIAQLPADLPPFSANFALQETVFLSHLIDRDTVLPGAENGRLTQHDLVNHARLALDDFQAIKERAVINTLLLDYANHLGLLIDQDTLQQEKEALQERFGLDKDADWQQWRQRQQLTKAAWQQFIHEQALIRQMKKAFANRTNNHALLRQLRLEGLYEAVAETAVAQANTLSNSHLLSNRTINDRIQTYLTSKGLKTPEAIHAHAASLGFTSYASFMLALEQYQHHHHHAADNAT